MPRPIFKKDIDNFISSSIRVNLAGELAAVIIYSSQKKFLEQNCECVSERIDDSFNGFVKEDFKSSEPHNSVNRCEQEDCTNDFGRGRVDDSYKSKNLDTLSNSLLLDDKFAGHKCVLHLLKAKNSNLIDRKEIDTNDFVKEDFKSNEPYKSSESYNSLNRCEHIVMIDKILSQETAHFEYFKQAVKEFDISPSIFMVLWKELSEFFGVYSMKLSKKVWTKYYLGSIFATYHVEEIIKKHYKFQVEKLEEYSKLYNLSVKENIALFNRYQELHKNIKQFLLDEESHFTESEETTKKYKNFFEKIWYRALSYGCLSAINLSKKF